MPEERERPDGVPAPGPEDDPDAGSSRSGSLPEVPVVAVKLPPDPARPRPGADPPGSYARMGIAYQAAASFITPFILLPLVGMWLDQKMHWSTPWGVIAGFILGMAVGINLLLQTMRKLGD